MAKTPIYDEATIYVVSFKRVVTRGAFKYLPRDLPEMTGATLNKIILEHGADVVRSADPRD